VSTALFAVGYPVAIVVIARWVPVVREQRRAWFVAHQLAVAAIVAGWALRQRWPAASVNAAWFVVAAVWYVSRRPRP
jgi:hypothetical protein